VEAIGNTFEDIRSDGAIFANVRHVVIEANTFANFHPALELGDHPDMIQVWNDGSFGDMYDVIIRNNVLMKGTGGDVQCIFVQGAIAGANQTTPSYAHDLIVEGNLIEGGAAQGIWVSHVEQTLIASNSLTQAADGQVAPSIRTDHTLGTTVTNNFAPRIEDFGSTALTSSGNTITGGVGSGSTVAGTDGGDTLNGTAGNDVVLAAGGDDLVYGKDGSDSISGGEGKDRLHGDSGNDTLNGGSGKDELRGGDGNDGLFGGGGDDRLLGENGNDVLFGDGGHDMLNGGAGADELHGGTGNDGFFGGGGDDRLFGDSGVDTIYGDGGDDRIDGGTGDDVLRGGAGNDTFAFGIGCGSDTIADFQDGFDKLDFSRLPAIGSAADLAIESVSATVTVVRFFDGIEDVELTITGTAAVVLDHADFLFGAA
jgi:Ca2+-binding RTX toxin-like protein